MVHLTILYDHRVVPVVCGVVTLARVSLWASSLERSCLLCSQSISKASSIVFF